MVCGKATVSSILAIFAALAVMTLSCQSEGSRPGGSDSQSIMTALKTKLESGVSFGREDPLTIRPFQPNSDDNWQGDAVAYGCYRKGQAPGQRGPSDAELLEDLEIISKHWKLIRVYGADNDTRRILQVIHENNLPIKVIQGIWLSPEEDSPQEKNANIQSLLLGI